MFQTREHIEVGLTFGVPGVAAPSLGEVFLLQHRQKTEVEFSGVAVDSGLIFHECFYRVNMETPETAGHPGVSRSFTVFHVIKLSLSSLAPLSSIPSHPSVSRHSIFMVIENIAADVGITQNITGNSPLGQSFPSFVVAAEAGQKRSGDDLICREVGLRSL